MRRHERRQIILVDDGRALLGPLTETRPVWDVRTGALSVRERAESAIGPIFGCFTAKNAVIDAADHEQSTLLLSGRAAFWPVEISSLAEGDALVEPESGDLIAGVVPPGALEHWVDSLGSTPDSANVQTASTACLLARPWDVIRHRNAAIASDLQRIIRDEDRPESSEMPGVRHLGEQPIAIDFSASVLPGVTLDTTHGPIVICEHAVVRPGAIIVGPAYIGPRSTVLEHASIKANTAIGPVCKVAGEVGGTIFQGYANKSHDGHLGDSWIGQWVNLGAATVNSNLLNTYSEVVARIDPASSRERTGLTFLGAILGDHVKTAIGTRLMTGSVIGTGAMLASTQAPPASVASFAWLTDGGESIFRLDKFLDTARAVMDRRDQTLSEGDEAILRDLHGKAMAARS